MTGLEALLAVAAVLVITYGLDAKPKLPQTTRGIVRLVERQH